MKEIYFFYKEFENRNFYSQKRNDYYISYDISDQVWYGPNELAKGSLLTLDEILKILPKNVDKKHRSLIHRFNTDIFPVRDKISFDLWNGCILIDLDLDKHRFPANFDHEFFYNLLKDALYNEVPNNFYYIEHSSSKVGIHIFFYFDVERTEENYHKCAAYSRWLLFNKIDKRIKDFSRLLSVKGVFDAVYDRPFQKCFLTGIDAEINKYISGETVFDNDFKYEGRVINEPDTSVYEITNVIKTNKKWSPEYAERLRIYTALKKVTNSEQLCNAYWSELCKNFINTKYNYDTLCKQFNYNSIKTDSAKISILEKYGIKIEKAKITHNLRQNEFLSDILQQILDETCNGVNFLQAGTGVGKTRAWIELNNEIEGDIFNFNNERPILIVEPLNSIIETKYPNNVHIINRSKKFPSEISNYGMYVTNYNKLIKKKGDGFEMREDIVKFLSQFQIVVIDESHLMIKDAFRSDVLVPFIESINKVGEKTKVILQTATPMDEERLFDIKNHIVVNKPTDKDIKFLFRKVKPDSQFHIQDLNCITKYYINAGRKVYIYWNNASLQKLNSFKQTYFEPDRVAIYHKRNDGENSMQYIKENKKLGDKYDVLLSSVYFGVGCDLEDECDTAVILVGNNTWQEDVQAIGRWRNSKNIEVCQINFDVDYDFLTSTKGEVKTRDRLIVDEQIVLEKLLHDKQKKDKSIIISKKAYQIKKNDDIKTLSVIKSSEEYYSTYKEKIKSLSDKYYGIRIKEDLERELECNDDYNDKLKKYNKEVKNIRNAFIKEIVTGQYDDISDKEKEQFYNRLNRDTKVEKWYRLWRKLKRFNIDEILPISYLVKTSHYNILNCWYEYYRQLSSREIDYPELYALLWFRDRVKEVNNKEVGIIDGVELTMDKYYSILAYIVFIHNKNKFDNDYRILTDYFGTFKKNCNLFLNMPDELVELFYKPPTNNYDMSLTMEFFNVTEWKDNEFETIIIESMSDVKNQMERMEKTMIDVWKIVKKSLKYFTISGVRSIATSKQITITDKFPVKKLEKYHLNVNQTFETGNSLSEHCKVNRNRITDWKSKGWVI